MAEGLTFLFLAYQRSIQLMDTNYIHKQMWIRYGYAESPGYNVFMCLMHALENFHNLLQFQQEVNQIQIEVGGCQVDVDLVYYARHMEDTLQHIQEGLSLRPLQEF